MENLFNVLGFQKILCIFSSFIISVHPHCYTLQKVFCKNDFAWKIFFIEFQVSSFYYLSRKHPFIWFSYELYVKTIFHKNQFSYILTFLFLKTNPAQIQLIVDQNNFCEKQFFRENSFFLK